MSSDNQQLARIEDQNMSDENRAIIKAPITSAQAKIDAVANLTMKAYERASTLTITTEETAALEADFTDDAFQPGAAGKEHLIYIEHAHLRQRLNKVFGPGQWAIVPRNRWAEDFSTGKGTEASRVYVEAMLCVRGCFVAEAVGDMVYYKNNDSQNYGDAVEGAKTAALRRCAKELGIGLQAWKKEFCEGWWTRRRSGKRGPEPTKTASNVPHGTRSSPTTAPRDAPSAKPPAPAQASEKTRAWFLAEMRKRFKDLDILQWACDDGPPYRLTPNESLEDWPLECVPTSKTQLAEDIAQCAKFLGIDPQTPAEAPQDDGDLGPQITERELSDPDNMPVLEGGVETMVGILEKISEKSGTSKKGPWTRFGVCVSGRWFSTFNAVLAKSAESLKSHSVRVYYKPGERGDDLVGIERAKQS